MSATKELSTTCVVVAETDKRLVNIITVTKLFINLAVNPKVLMTVHCPARGNTTNAGIDHNLVNDVRNLFWLNRTIVRTKIASNRFSRIVTLKIVRVRNLSPVSIKRRMLLK